MSSPKLYDYRVGLVAYGSYAVWVTAESEETACALAERMWGAGDRTDFDMQDAGVEHVEVLDTEEFEEGHAT